MARTSKKDSSKAIPASTLKRLQTWNLALGVIYAVQAVLIIVLSQARHVPFTTNYLTQDSLATKAAGESVLTTATRHLFDVNLVYAVAAFLAVAAVAHILLATLYRRNYEADLTAKRNRARGLEHIIGGGLVLLVISLVNGVYDFSTLLAIFALVEITALFSVLTEANQNLMRQHPKVVGKLLFVSSITPWLIIGAYLLGAQLYATQPLPRYVYWIDATMLVLFGAWAVNMYRQRKQKGKWADYVYGERVYMMLGLGIKTVLAWQIYLALLRG